MRTESIVTMASVYRPLSCSHFQHRQHHRQARPPESLPWPVARASRTTLTDFVCWPFSIRLDPTTHLSSTSSPRQDGQHLRPLHRQTHGRICTEEVSVAVGMSRPPGRYHELNPLTRHLYHSPGQEKVQATCVRATVPCAMYDAFRAMLSLARIGSRYEPPRRLSLCRDRTDGDSPRWMPYLPVSETWVERETVGEGTWKRTMASLERESIHRMQSRSESRPLSALGRALSPQPYPDDARR